MVQEEEIELEINMEIIIIYFDEVIFLDYLLRSDGDLIGAG